METISEKQIPGYPDYLITIEGVVLKSDTRNPVYQVQCVSGAKVMLIEGNHWSMPLIEDLVSQAFGSTETNGQTSWVPCSNNL